MTPVLALVIVALAVACDGGRPTGVTPGQVELSSVDTLRTGEIALLRGSGLTGLASLRVDGIAVTELLARSDSVAEFRVPVMRACETDMRVVSVTSESAEPITGVVRVAPTIALLPGETRILAEDDLKCLRLRAGDEDYVLSAANIQVPVAETEVMRTLVDLRVLGTGEPPLSARSLHPRHPLRWT